MRPEGKWRLIRFSITALAMFAVWILFVWSLDLFSLAAGALGALGIASLTYDVFIARHQANLRFFLPRPVHLAIYLCLLFLLIYQASFRMLAAVVTGRASPRIVHFKTRLRSDFARMVLANSITLTPGTVTLDLNDDHLTVHWFFCSTTHSTAAGNEVKGRLEAYVRKVWL